MCKTAKKIYNYNQKMFHELYVAETLIHSTIKLCEDTEFAGEYYGISDNNQISKISFERNNCINMLTLLSERIDNIMNLNLSVEKAITLE